MDGVWEIRALWVIGGRTGCDGWKGGPEGIEGLAFIKDEAVL